MSVIICELAEHLLVVVQNKKTKRKIPKSYFSTDRTWPSSKSMTARIPTVSTDCGKSVPVEILGKSNMLPYRVIYDELCVEQSTEL